jgi:hypothetical protein
MLFGKRFLRAKHPSSSSTGRYPEETKGSFLTDLCVFLYALCVGPILTQGPQRIRRDLEKFLRSRKARKETAKKKAKEEFARTLNGFSDDRLASAS